MPLTAGQGLSAGQVLQNRYRIVKPLGQGGMGAVYRAWHLSLGMPIAVKEMAPQPDLDPETLHGLREQFKQEAAVLVRLKHHNLVGVLDYFVEQDNAYLVMEFIDGESLADRIARVGPLPEGEVLDCARRLLDALAYCHSQGVLHRDIKPQNIILRPDGDLVLVDFGLVKLWNTGDPRTRAIIRGMGTPEYAPPEQYGGGVGVHTAPYSDIYSLGATLYHALTGQAPASFTDRIANPGALRPPAALRRDVSPQLEDAVMRAMALKPQARFASAAEMQRALAPAASVQVPADGPAAQVWQPVSATSRAPAATQVAPSSAPQPAFTPSAPSASQPARKRRGVPLWLWFAVVSVLSCLLLVFGLGGIVLLANLPGDAPDTTAAPTGVRPATPTRDPDARVTPRPTRDDREEELVTAVPFVTEAPFLTVVPEVIVTEVVVPVEPEPWGTPEPPLKVALLVPLSGPVMTFGESARNGVMLAVDQWNAGQGVLGREIELIVEDGQCTADVAVSAANKVIDQDGVQFIIGEICSSASIPVAEIAAAEGVLQISPTSTNPRVTVAEDGSTHDTVFRACFIDMFQGEVAAAFARDTLGAATAAVLFDEENTYVRGLAETFIAAFEARGGAVTVQGTYTWGEEDYSLILDEVEDADPDIIYLPDYYNTVNLIASQARGMGIMTPLLGGDGWDSADLDRVVTEGGYYTNHFSADDPRPVVQVFVSAYEAAYGVTPDAIAALSYDAAQLLFQAMLDAGATDDPYAVARALQRGTFDLVSGVTGFDAQHNPRKSAVILKIEGGQVVYYDTVSP